MKLESRKFEKRGRKRVSMVNSTCRHRLIGEDHCGPRSWWSRLGHRFHIYLKQLQATARPLLVQPNLGSVFFRGGAIFNVFNNR